MVTLNKLFPKHGSRKEKRRLGLGPGSGLGNYCTKGMKGQSSRSGNTRKESKEGGQMPLIRRVPKRGFTNNWKKVYTVINVSQLAKLAPNTVVTAEMLKANGMIAKIEEYGLKVIGNGEINVPLTVKANKISASAIEKIQKAGGTIEVV